MAIGLGMLRAAARRRRPGRAGGHEESPRSTVREVCLIGLDRRSPAEGWTAGREVTWLGRKYEVRATAGDEAPPAGSGGPVTGPIRTAARRYVHLAPCDGV